MPNEALIEDERSLSNPNGLPLQSGTTNVSAPKNYSKFSIRYDENIVANVEESFYSKLRELKALSPKDAKSELARLMADYSLSVELLRENDIADGEYMGFLDFYNWGVESGTDDVTALVEQLEKVNGRPLDVIADKSPYLSRVWDSYFYYIIEGGNREIIKQLAALIKVSEVIQELKESKKERITNLADASILLPNFVIVLWNIDNWVGLPTTVENIVANVMDPKPLVFEEEKPEEEIANQLGQSKVKQSKSVKSTKNHILVTGAHRSGSTWVGTILSMAENIRYIHEPFNPANRKDIPIKKWYEHISESTALKHQKKVRSYIRSFYSITFKSLWSDLWKIRKSKDIYLYLANNKGKITDRTVLKDPIALFSCEWLYDELPLDVVVLLRHPAAFVASLKVKKWRTDFNMFLNQPDLMKKIPAKYHEQIIDYANTDTTIIEEGVLMWKLIYSTVADYQSKYATKWCFVKHEDLSAKPMVEFEKLFSFLNISMNVDIKKKIAEYSKAETASDLKRNSLKNIFTWQDRLSSEEIKFVKEETYDVWTKFYQESDWVREHVSIEPSVVT